MYFYKKIKNFAFYAKSPHKFCIIDSATTEAVSVLRTLLPKFTGTNELLKAKFISFSEKPPSGPT